MTCHYDNIFLGKTHYRNMQLVLLSGHSCLQADLNHTVPIGRSHKTLTRVNINPWNIPVTPAYYCSYGATLVRKYDNYHVRAYKA